MLFRSLAVVIGCAPSRGDPALLLLNQGTIYASLVRLLQKGWITAAWGTSDNNRKAKFYSITGNGRKQLREETENWERIAAVMGRVLQL